MHVLGACRLHACMHGVGLCAGPYCVAHTYLEKKRKKTKIKRNGWCTQSVKPSPA
eukprot:NODE_6719_length_253_cov_11.754902_g6636_i0.p3 GENE.NODE_6719_length_253_cov_11.754902_g6636_i0~~NODE_6719_length_253_cov_11.754902_g6636_i0.p3  ORF type:complete len:55 (+),score=8.74 NODE_6719_length_253_cov_11.754902_g6636_i0:83-247(+)